jgi:glutathione S-transferase
MKLLGSDTSPFVRKVRIVLAEKKIDAQYQRIDLARDLESLRKANPLGKIPCLLVDERSAIFDSRVIVEYLDNLTPVHRLIPPSGRERVDVRTLEAMADGLLDAAILIRAEMTQRDEAMRSRAWIDRQLGKIDGALAALDDWLGDSPWLVDGKYSLADIAAGCALAYLDFRFAEIDWRTRHPRLAHYADKLFARQSFADTAARVA